MPHYVWSCPNHLLWLSITWHFINDNLWNFHSKLDTTNWWWSLSLPLHWLAVLWNLLWSHAGVSWLFRADELMGFWKFLKMDITRCPHCGKILHGTKGENKRHKMRCKKKKKRKKEK